MADDKQGRPGPKDPQPDKGKGPPDRVPPGRKLPKHRSSTKRV